MTKKKCYIDSKGKVHLELSTEDIKKTITREIDKNGEIKTKVKSRAKGKAKEEALSELEEDLKKEAEEEALNREKEELKRQLEENRRNKQKEVSKVVVKSKIVTELLRSMNGFDGEIGNISEVIKCRDIGLACEEIIRYRNSINISDEEYELYKTIMFRYTGYVKEHYLAPISGKKEQLMYKLKNKNSNITIEEHERKVIEYNKAIRDCFDIRARQFELDSYLIALEWNRNPENRFYLPRRECLMNLEDINGEKFSIVQDLQDLIDGKLDVLSESMPQRTGKSRLSLFALSLLAFKNLEKSIFGVGHSSGLIDDFYNEIIAIYEDTKTYRAFDIFKNHIIQHKDSDKHTIDIDRRKGISNFIFRSIDGNITGSAEASLCMYSDDLIKDQSEVINKDIADKIWSKFNVLVLGRMKESIPLLYVGTLWGENCPLSRLIDEYGKLNNERYRFRQIAWHNSKGESQFNYKYNLGFTTEHFKRLERTMAESDYALWCAMYESDPISREGRPFSELKYYTELPNREPDFKCFGCDVAVSSGGDYWSMPIGYVYEKEREIYIEDIVYSNKGTDYTIPKSVEMIIKHRVDSGEFEEKEGALNKRANYGVADTINRLLKKNGYRCNIGCHSASGLKSKKSRILSCRSEILGIETDYSYKIYFKDKSIRQGNTEYSNFIKHIRNWSDDDAMQKKQIDDGVDSLSMLITYNIDNHKQKARKINTKIY